MWKDKNGTWLVSWSDGRTAHASQAQGNAPWAPGWVTLAKPTSQEPCMPAHATTSRRRLSSLNARVDICISCISMAARYSLHTCLLGVKTITKHRNIDRSCHQISPGVSCRFRQPRRLQAPCVSVATAEAEGMSVVWRGETTSDVLKGAQEIQTGSKPLVGDV